MGNKKRILGDLRIFQSVHNDLHLLHQPEKHAYMYPGVDPYELEDDKFPGTVAAIQAAVRKAVREARLDEVVWYSNHVGILHEPWEEYEKKRKAQLQDSSQGQEASR